MKLSVIESGLSDPSQYEALKAGIEVDLAETHAIATWLHQVAEYIKAKTGVHTEETIPPPPPPPPPPPDF